MYFLCTFLIIKGTMFSLCNHNHLTRSSAYTGIIKKIYSNPLTEQICIIKTCSIFNKLPEKIKTPNPCSLASYLVIKIYVWILLIGKFNIGRMIMYKK